MPAAARGDEDETDRSLRPRQLDEFVGQEVVREQLSIALAAARERGEPIDHVLLAGPPGLGKSTLAHIVATEMDTRLITVSGPGLDRKGDLVAILADLADRDVVFIDEVHRLNRSVEETLYPAMEDGVVDIIMGQGPGARSLRLDLAPFTLIGATTRASLLTKPLRDRFGIVFRLDHYSPAELVRIAQRSAGILGIQMQDDAAAELAQRARGTPRLANRLLRRVRDFAQVRGDGAIDHATAVAALDLLGVDAEGLDRLDRELLRMIAETFEGGPGRAVDAGRRDRGGSRHDRGRLRAVSAAEGLAAADAAGARDHTARACPPRAPGHAARGRPPPVRLAGGHCFLAGATLVAPAALLAATAVVAALSATCADAATELCSAEASGAGCPPPPVLSAKTTAAATAAAAESEAPTRSAAAPRAAGSQRRRRELGGQARVEAGRHVSGQRLLAEAGELQAHGLQLVVRHVLLEARVIHVR